MTEWSSGYNVDVGYTHGFYREMSPNWLDYVARLNGLSAPVRSKRFLELGCGYGFGLTLLAALHPDREFLGIDFNPVHIAHARDLAAEAGLTNIRFEEADFVELSYKWPSEWGEFDYVAAHGTYTWLSQPVREAVTATINKASASGALVYLSYNSLPGCNYGHSIQHLLRMWQTSESLGSLEAIGQGIQRLKNLKEANAGLIRSMPNVGARLDKMATEDKSYLVHEYLHDNWHPLWFDQVVKELDDAKLNFVGSAAIGDFYLSAVLPEDQKAVLSQYNDPTVREVMLDVLLNRGFRKDVFARGRVPMLPIAHQESLRQTAFVLVQTPDVASIKFHLSVGEVSGKQTVYEPLVDALSKGPKTIEDLMALEGKTLGDTVQAVTLMLHAGMVALYQPETEQQQAKSLNATIMKKVAQGAPYKYLVASALGSIIPARDIDLIMAAELNEDSALEDSTKLGERLAQRLMDLGKGLVKEGQVLENQDAMNAHGKELAVAFLQKTLPSWRRLGIL